MKSYKDQIKDTFKQILLLVATKYILMPRELTTFYIRAVGAGGTTKE